MIKNLGIGFAVCAATLSACLLIRGVSKYIEASRADDKAIVATAKNGYTRRVVKPLSGIALVYVADLDTIYKPNDTIVVMSPTTGDVVKAVVIR
jgi:hypothetical protein